jgi:uncharacterized protein (TIGR00645 family)
MTLKSIIEKSRYLAFIGILSLLVAAVATFAWGALRTWQVIVLVVSSLGTDKKITVGFIEIIDVFLIATTLIIFMLSLYELFIDKVDAPEWMLAHNLYELKGKLSSMIVLVMAVKFLEKFIEARDANELMLTAIATTLVSAVLIAFGYFGRKE